MLACRSPSDAKPVAKTQRCVRRDAALAIDDSGDPIDRHVNLPRQLRCRNDEFLQLFGKMLAGVNRGARYGMPHLVVIHDLDIDRAGRSFGPFNANPPLVIDADAAVLSLAVTIEGFKPIAAMLPRPNTAHGRGACVAAIETLMIVCRRPGAILPRPSQSGIATVSSDLCCRQALFCGLTYAGKWPEIAGV